MENSKQQVVTNTITRELKDIAAPTGNVYESTMIIAKRANQIAAEIKQELSHKLEEFSNYQSSYMKLFAK